MYKQTIGLIGGFGAYAGLDFYRRILEKFASGSERDYPHIIMDNDFTMPSRTRALLYDENYEEVVAGIAGSMKKMIAAHADRIVMVCGTAHYFLDDVYRIVPEAEARVVHMIDCLGRELERRHVREVLVVAAEGALRKGVYQKRLSEYGVKCIVPQREDYSRIRYFIENVKGGVQRILPDLKYS